MPVPVPVVSDSVGDRFPDSGVPQEAQILLPVVQAFMMTSLGLVHAQRGVLLRWQGGGLLVEAQAHARRDQLAVDMASFAPRRDELPLSLIEDVVRTCAPAVLEAASPSGPRGIDPFLDAHPDCSVIVLPLMQRECLAGMLYLERHGPGPTVTGQQMRFLDLLAGQATVSLETARLYAAAAGEIRACRQGQKVLQGSRAMLLLGERINQSGSWSWDVEAGVVNPSAECCRIYDIDPGVSVIDFDALIQHVHPCDREHVIRMLDEAATGQRSTRFEHRIHARDGDLRYLSVIAQPILEAQGKLVVGTVSDISSRKADELALSKAQAELARGARLATIGQVTALVAHEVNQPLMSISSNAGAALIRFERGVPDAGKFRQLLREIVDQSQRAGTIIQRLQALAYRRPQAEPVDFHALVHQVLLTMRGELDRHQIAVELDLRERPMCIEGDATQLQQVLANLVGNAVDAMQAVEGRVRILHIASRSLEGDQVEVSVDDNGSGADAATCEHMFEPFVGTKPEGMGMGLAICRSIIESHGGRIRARARQPHGCSVIFTMAERAGTAACCETG